MQINYLHKNISKLYHSAKPQESLKIYYKKYEGRVHKWEDLTEGTSHLFL